MALASIMYLADTPQSPPNSHNQFICDQSKTVPATALGQFAAERWTLICQFYMILMMHLNAIISLANENILRNILNGHSVN